MGIFDLFRKKKTLIRIATVIALLNSTRAKLDWSKDTQYIADSIEVIYKNYKKSNPRENLPEYSEKLS